MDTDRYQALFDTLEMIKSRADECQEMLRASVPGKTLVRFGVQQMLRYCYKATDQAEEMFRAEEAA